MNWTLILLGFILLIVITFIVYQVLLWWNNRQLNKARRLYEQRNYDDKRTIVGGAEPVAPIESDSERSDGDEYGDNDGVIEHKISNQ